MKAQGVATLQSRPCLKKLLVFIYEQVESILGVFSALKVFKSYAGKKSCIRLEYSPTKHIRLEYSPTKHIRLEYSPTKHDLP